MASTSRHSGWILPNLTIAPHPPRLLSLQFKSLFAKADIFCFVKVLMKEFLEIPQCKINLLYILEHFGEQIKVILSSEISTETSFILCSTLEVESVK